MFKRSSTFNTSFAFRGCRTCASPRHSVVDKKNTEGKDRELGGGERRSLGHTARPAHIAPTVSHATQRVPTPTTHRPWRLHNNHLIQTKKTTQPVRRNKFYFGFLCFWQQCHARCSTAPNCDIKELGSVEGYIKKEEWGNFTSLQPPRSPNSTNVTAQTKHQLDNTGRRIIVNGLVEA